MVELGTSTNIKGCRKNLKYQRYFDRANRLYFEGNLGPITVYTAPLLNITKLSQKEALDKKSWVDAGLYAITGYDSEGNMAIILDRGTAIFHPMLTKQSILHEAIHWSIGLDKGHGKLFKKEIRRIAALGAFDNLI